MHSFLELAHEELKRTDHLIYVSLKYTRTVDVLQTILNRLIKCFEFSLKALIKKLVELGEIDIAPNNVLSSLSLIKEKYPNPDFISMINFFMIMRRIVKEEPVKSNEFRRGVRMSCVINKIVYEVDIDTAEEYFKTTEVFLRIVKKLIDEPKLDLDQLKELIQGVMIDIEFERG
jgi:hypothetical protein